MGKRFWPELFDKIRELCKFLDKWQDHLPNDLPLEVVAAIAAIRAACLVLKSYDKSHPGGKYSA